jgi:sigma-B regulation protein RsbU (phosphoserine phosphatase)
MTEPPVVFHYQQALDAFRRAGESAPLLKRMSELVSLVDFTTTLGSGLAEERVSEAALLLVMGELQVSRGGLLVREEGGGFVVRAARGLPPTGPLEIPELARGEVLRGPGAPVCAALGLDLLVPISRGVVVFGALGVGPRARGQAYGVDELAFLRSLAACAATSLENGLMAQRLRTANRQLTRRLFELRGLFEASRELTTAADPERTRTLVVATLLGHLMASRCALLESTPAGLEVTHERGLRWEGSRVVAGAAAGSVLASLAATGAVADLPAGELRDVLQQHRLALAVPLLVGGRAEGLLAVGERPSGKAYSDEDREFAELLGRQAAAAFESIRLQQAQVEQQRRDREMQIAREIQQSLFPAGCPALAGLALAAASRPCYQVGGDLYDFIPLGPDRLGLVIADVSGKGAPASILMASVHASLRALAGSLPAAELLARVNRFLFESTQANKYVTLFYAELDGARLRYVNAGHVPPYHLTGGGVRRLEAGGPAVGLLESVDYEEGVVDLVPGDVVAMVTDGVTEALSVDDREFGDAGAIGTLQRVRGESAPDILDALVRDAVAWAGAAGCSDDLTALVLKATA